MNQALNLKLSKPILSRAAEEAGLEDLKELCWSICSNILKLKDITHQQRLMLI